ncbi:MAG: hypothetical protein KatS3mg087_1205 [Patescibacteria group bacterium]|nr:MAG: hypothetical protein KatS3mg087_1205 [Patescibacteria group bacterium]
MIRNSKGIVLNSVSDLEGLTVNNALFRSRFAGISVLDRRRDYNKELGYPDESEIQPIDLWRLFKRNPIARRVVSILPLECWSVHPTIYETDDEEQETDFERALKEVSQLGGKSWLTSGSYYSALFAILRRADLLSGVGTFGIIVLGLDDTNDLSKPVDTSRQNKLVYLSVFPEAAVTSIEFASNPLDENFRKPLYYKINPLYDLPASNSSTNGAYKEIIVHRSRVIHIADNADSGEIFGTPRMLPVFDRLIDLTKLYGGGAEGYWRSCFTGLAFETHPQLGADAEIDREELQREVWDYVNGLQRALAVTGMSVKTLAPSVVDPSSQIERQIEAICLVLGCPKRIFMGSERGELASSQDKESWELRLMERRLNYITPFLIAPLIDRLIEINVLPEPKEGYKVHWPSPDEMSPIEKVEWSQKVTDVMAKYIAGQVNNLVAPMDFLVKILGFDRDEAMSILETALESMADEMTTKDFKQNDNNDESGENADSSKENDNEAGQQTGENDKSVENTANEIYITLGNSNKVKTAFSGVVDENVAKLEGRTFVVKGELKPKVLQKLYFGAVSNDISLARASFDIINYCEQDSNSVIRYFKNVPYYVFRGGIVGHLERYEHEQQQFV